MINDMGITKSESVDKNTMMPEEMQPDDEKESSHPLDSAKMIKKLHRCQEWYEQEWQRQAHNRFQMAMDEDYYDSLQWTEEDALQVTERGQAPLVFNEVKPTIDWMIGTERRTKIDYKVLPRKRGPEYAADAETKTALLKYLDDTNKASFVRSEAFANTSKSGLGWLEVGARGDRTDEPVYYRSENWRNMLYDSNGVERDLSDSRYLFRWKYIDVDVAQAYFPDRKELVRRAALDGNNLLSGEQEDELWYLGARVTEPGQDYASASIGKYRPYDGSAFAWSRRDRVKVYECWYRDPVMVKMMEGGDYDGQIYDRDSDDHNQAIEIGSSSIYDKREMEIRCAVYVDTGLLWEGRSPYRHQRFPFIPIWCYRRKRDNAPYGPIRVMRDPQDDLNKRQSKALWILSTNQIEMESGAVEDLDELREEAARPDGIIVRKKGYLLDFRKDIQLANEHLAVMDRDQAYIRNTGGVTEENLGRETNASSGKAIIARQDQGSVLTTEPFDNLHYAIQLAGEIELSLIEQYFTVEKQVRIVGERGSVKFMSVNEPDEDGNILNDITATQADFKVAEQDYRDSLRIAMFEALFDIVGKLAQVAPEIAVNMLDLVVDMADYIPNRDELVSRIREINGQTDPEREMTPQERQVKQAKADLERKQQELALAKVEAELKEIIAKGESLDAEALMKRVKSMQDAINGALQVLQVPQVAPVADQMMQGAGFVENGAIQPPVVPLNEPIAPQF